MHGFFTLSMFYWLYKSVTTDEKTMVTIPLKLFYLTWLTAVIGWSWATRSKEK